MLAGCATDGNVKPAPTAQQHAKVRKASVSHLENGRAGFIITEPAPMDEALRRDFERAVALMNSQDYAHAIELLESVIAQAPDLTAPHINIAIAYQNDGKTDLAEAHLQAALRLVPGHPVACNEYGLLYRKTGRFAEARAVYEQAVTRFPEYYPAHKNLGILCDLYQSDLACALTHYEIYSQGRPEDKQVKLWIADLRARIERQQAAGSN
jgi:Tfp pilus assembly protein PilF